jgi:hypothetical protein
MPGHLLWLQLCKNQVRFTCQWATAEKITVEDRSLNCCLIRELSLPERLPRSMTATLQEPGSGGELTHYSRTKWKGRQSWRNHKYMRLYVRPHYTKVYDPANRVTDSTCSVILWWLYAMVFVNTRTQQQIAFTQGTHKQAAHATTTKRSPIENPVLI